MGVILFDQEIFENISKSENALRFLSPNAYTRQRVARKRQHKMIDDQRPTTQAVAVYDQIRRDIRSGALEPGMPLRTELLKTRYGSGVSPTREALARLAAEHFVTAEGKKGFRVAQITRNDFNELVTIRQELEIRAIELAIQHGDDDWEANIVAAYHRLKKTRPPGHIENPADEEERERRHRDYHMALIAGCRSRWLLRFCEQLTAHLERYRRILNPQSIISTGIAAEIEEEHRALMEAMLNRSTKDAVEIINHHRDRTYDVILSRFETFEQRTAAAE
jgi:DNA-binding GntR family transcriptional regulator